jgi:O-antigen/teichoic acid export membrane protein
MTDALPRATSAPSRVASGTAHMVVSTFVSAAGAFVFLVIVGRVLGPAAFAPITVLWTLQYLAFTVIYVPMEQLTVSRLSRTRPEATPWALYLWVTAACTAVAVVFAVLTRDRFFAGDAAFLPIVVVLMVGYAGFLLGRGYLAGQGRFKEYAFVISAESLMRLPLAGVLLAVGVGAVGMGWIMAAAPLVIWLWRPLRGLRRLEAGRRPERGATAALATFVLANAASHSLLAAGPLVVGALGAGAVAVSVVGQTFLLLRAPLAVAINVVSRVLPPLTRFVETGQVSRLRRLGAGLAFAGVALAGAGFAAGYFAGPAVVGWLMGPEYRPEALLAATAAGGTALATVALFAQQVFVAMRATGHLAVTWICGLGAAALIVAVGGMDPSLRVGWAFLVGESVSFLLLIVMVAAAGQSAAAAPTPDP